MSLHHITLPDHRTMSMRAIMMTMIMM